jgi:hypothetical protein
MRISRQCVNVRNLSAFRQRFQCSLAVWSSLGCSARLCETRISSIAIKVLGFCGSVRRDSLNGKLLEIALFGPRDAGAGVTQIRLTDLKSPIYDGDAEVGAALIKLATKLYSTD